MLNQRRPRRTAGLSWVDQVKVERLNEVTEPGCIVRLSVCSSVESPEIEVLSKAEELVRLGAEATDVETDGERFWALGYFKGAPPAGLSVERWLPPADGKPLPNRARRPVELGGISICGSDALSVPSDRPSLLVDSTSAFGSGLHPTTAMILDRLARRPVRGEVLDIGTGSGILALASLRLGAATAIGVEVEATALEAARENARRNGLSDRFQGLAEAPFGRWELVLANIRAKTLVRLASALVERLAPSGILLLSGVRFHEERCVESAYSSRGLQVVGRSFCEGWWCLELA